MLVPLLILATTPGMPPVAPAPIPIDSGVPGLPMGVHATAVAGLIAGLLLWSLGGRMIKLAMAVVGAALGAGLGAMLVPTLGLTAVAGFPAHLVGLIGGAVVGLIASFLLFRFAMVIAGAGVIGAAAALAGLVYVNVAPPPADLETPAELAPIIEWNPGSEPGAGAPVSSPVGEDPTLDPQQAVTDLVEQQARDEAARQADAAGEGLRSMVSDDTAAALEETATRVRDFVHHVWQAFVAQWNALDAAQRLVMAGFVIIGLAAGALIGLAMPTRSAAMLTSLAGSAIWLASLAWLAQAMQLPGRQWLVAAENAGLRWLIVWPVVALIGLVFQLKNLKKPAEGEPSRASRKHARDDRSERDDKD